jgi:hypothetical protein
MTHVRGGARLTCEQARLTCKGCTVRLYIHVHCNQGVHIRVDLTCKGGTVRLHMYVHVHCNQGIHIRGDLTCKWGTVRLYVQCTRTLQPRRIHIRGVLYAYTCMYMYIATKAYTHTCKGGPYMSGVANCAQQRQQYVPSVEILSYMYYS